MASFTVNTKQTAIKKDMDFECPECTEESDKCINPLHESFAEEVSAGATRLKAGEISREEYDKICFEASNKRNKQLRKCLEVYNACCFKKTQEIIEKEKQDKESIN